MEKLINELLKELTNKEKIPDLYEILLKLDKIDTNSKNEIQEFINGFINSED